MSNLISSMNVKLDNLDNISKEVNQIHELKEEMSKVLKTVTNIGKKVKMLKEDTASLNTRCAAIENKLTTLENTIDDDKSDNTREVPNEVHALKKDLIIIITNLHRASMV